MSPCSADRRCVVVLQHSHFGTSMIISDLSTVIGLWLICVIALYGWSVNEQRVGGAHQIVHQRCFVVAFSLWLKMSVLTSIDQSKAWKVRYIEEESEHIRKDCQPQINHRQAFTQGIDSSISSNVDLLRVVYLLSSVGLPPAFSWWVFTILRKMSEHSEPLTEYFFTSL